MQLTGPYRTSRPTLEFQLCCSLMMWLWDVIWLPESVYYLQNPYDPFLIYFKMWYKDWMKSSFSACQCLTKNTSDSVNTHVLHFCPPGLQSYLPAVSLLPLFQGGWVSTAQHLAGKVPLIFLKSINPSSRPVSIAGQHYCSLLRALGKHLLCMLRLATLLTQSF